MWIKLAKSKEWSTLKLESLQTIICFKIYRSYFKHLISMILHYYIFTYSIIFIRVGSLFSMQVDFDDHSKLPGSHDPGSSIKSLWSVQNMNIFSSLFHIFDSSEVVFCGLFVSDFICVRKCALGENLRPISKANIGIYQEVHLAELLHRFVVIL